MSRGRDISEPPLDALRESGSSPSRSRRDIDRPDPARPEGRTVSREPLRWREELPGLSGPEREALVDIGRFRTVDARDLNLGSRQLAALRRRGFVRTRTMRLPKGQRLEAVTLSRRARNILQRQTASQALHCGFQQPRQLAHDTALYRLYRQEAERIRSQGGRLRRILLEQELKGKVFSAQQRTSRSEAAARHRLKLVRGKVALPDLRIEYATPEGREARVDLELVTEHYRPGQIAAKMQAGFCLYGLAPANSAQGASVREERGLQEILSI